MVSPLGPAALFLFTAFVPIAPAGAEGAAPAHESNPQSDSWYDAWEAVGKGGLVPFLLQDSADPEDPASGAAPLDASKRGRTEAGTAPQPGHNQEGYPMGDMSGDGVTDVLVSEYRTDTYRLARFHAYSGSDGSPLWPRPVEVGFRDRYYTLIAEPLGDVDADGRGDVVAVGLVWAFSSFHHACPSEPILAECTFVWWPGAEWRVFVLSGATGATLWNRTIEYNAFTRVDGYIVAQSFVVAHQQVRVENATLLPLVSADHDGDGGPDVILHRIHYETDAVEAGAAPAVGGASLIRMDNEVEVLNGRTGAAIWSTPLEDRPQFTFMVPTSDRTGDGAGDILLQTVNQPIYAYGCTVVPGCVEAVPSTQRLQVLDGRDLSPVWTRVEPALDFEYLEPVPHDLTGDGAADILSVVVGFDVAGERVVHFGVRSGDGGALLWTLDSDRDWGGVFPVRAAGGARSDLLLRQEPRSRLRGEPIHGTLDRLAGIDGAGLGSWSYDYVPTVDEMVFPSFGLVQDWDGNGFEEAALSADYVSFDEAGTVHVRSQARLLDLGSGSFLYAGDFPQTAYVRDAGDLDGDGRTDVVLREYQRDPGTTTLGLTALSSDRARSLWSRETNVLGALAFLLQDIGSADGHAGTDVYQQLYAFDATGLHISMSVIDGRHGRDLWTFSPG